MAGEEVAVLTVQLGEGVKLDDEHKDDYWGFSLFEAYKMAVKFYKENEGKRTFEVDYESKVHLAALTKQVSNGPFNQQGEVPEIGMLDVFGNDRRKVWTSFGDMSSNDARRNFIDKLQQFVPVFAPFMIAHQKKKEEEDLKRQQELAAELQRKKEEEERERLRLQAIQEEEERIRKQQEEEEQQRQEQEQQKQQIMAALNAQTQAQFQQYAAQQHPGNPEQQTKLIALLQEQHYQQYIKLYLEGIQQQQQQQQTTDEAAPAAGAEVPQPTATQTQPPVHPPRLPELQHEAGSEVSGEDEDNASEASLLQIAEPSLWTRPQIDDFKQQIKRDPESVLTIGRGEVVTIRVPTHEEGAYVFWEFASDSYDLGFGVLFEWSESDHGQQISVQHGETTDEESDELEDTSDPERAVGGANHAPVDEIVPVFRRDSHTEVHAGSHRYPGRGVYLLKFDNSYSLWRSKTLYYRVYYTR